MKHNHKKRKGSLEARTELAVLGTYDENQANLAPILLYRISKCKQRAGKRGLCYGPIFLPFYKIIVSFFYFSVKMQTKQDQTVLYNRLQFVKATQTNTV